MAVELFLLPMVATGRPRGEGMYQAKYTDDPQVIRHGTIKLGKLDQAVVMIEAPQTYLDFVQSQPDALLLATSQTIDNTINVNQRNAIRNWLENRGIPGLWVQTGETRRQVIRGVIGMFLISQRLRGRFGEDFKQRAVRYGVNLETTWADLPQALKDELLGVAADFGIPNPGLTNASPLRDVLKALGDGMQKFPFVLCGVTV